MQSACSLSGLLLANRGSSADQCLCCYCPAPWAVQPISFTQWTGPSLRYWSFPPRRGLVARERSIASTGTTDKFQPTLGMHLLICFESKIESVNTFNRKNFVLQNEIYKCMAADMIIVKQTKILLESSSSANAYLAKPSSSVIISRV